MTSPDDLRIAAYAAVKERDLAAREGLFVVEGQIALGKLIGSRFGIVSLLLAENRVEPPAAELAALDPAIPVYVAPQAAMDAVTGFHIHRGVLALARRGEETTTDGLLARLSSNIAASSPSPSWGGVGVGGPSSRKISRTGHAEPPPTPAPPHKGEGAPGSTSRPITVLALIGLANHDNIGACFRNAAALGADAILLDATSADPLYRKSIRVSSGAALTLPFAHSGDGASLLAALDQAGFAAWALSPTGGEPLHSLAPPERLAIFLGAEGPGLPADLLGRARRVSIPMAAGVDSLNVATAGAIALAHVAARRIDSPAKPYQR